MPLPRAADKKDPANRVFAVIGLIGLCVAVPLVVFVQQFMLQLHDVRLETAPASVRNAEVAYDPGIAEITLTAKGMTRAFYTFVEDGVFRQHKIPRDEVDQDDNPLLQPIERLAVSRVDRLRFAIVVGEFHGSYYALEMIRELAREAEPGGDLAADAAWLVQAYDKGAATLPADAREALIDRHGWFADLAFVYGLDNTDRQREDILAGHDRLAGFMRLVVTWQILGIVFGLLTFVIALVFLARGDLTGSFDAAAVGGSVYLECFVIFLLAFMALVLASVPFRGASSAGAAAGLALNEVLQWGLIAALAWPFFRGLGRSAMCIDLGLHTGEGVLKEALCGVIGFLADTGLSAAVMIAVALIGTAMEIEPAPEGDPSGFPMFEHPLTNSWAVVWIGAVGAVVWAPVYEEIMFRGCLYRFLHGKLRWIGAAAVSAIIFGAIHPYGIDGMIQVALGGFVYALLREWRGSLIAPIVAHMLHNLQLTLVELGYLSILGS